MNAEDEARLAEDMRAFSTPRPWKTLAHHLEDLEREDPEVRAVAEAFDRLAGDGAFRRLRDRFGTPSTPGTAWIFGLPLLCRAVRTSRGLSLRTAARQVGMPYADLHRFERGTSNPTLEVLLRVARWVESDG